MADNPDVRLRVHIREVVVKVLHKANLIAEGRTERRADRANGVEQAVVDERSLDAVYVALPAAAIAPADGCPCPVDAGAAAAEQQVIVQLVLLGGRAPAAKYTSRCALERQNDRRIIGRRKNVPAEAVCIGLPSKRIRLRASEREQD